MPAPSVEASAASAGSPAAARQWRRRRAAGNRRGAQEGGDPVLVLGLEHRAGDIDQPPARLDESRRPLERLRWSLMRCSSAPGRMRHFASGLRRHAPEPVQGASTNTRSQRPARSDEDVALARAARAPARCARPSAPAARTSARGGGRRCRWRRPGPDCSSIAASASVLPPAPAQRSSTCMPGVGAATAARRAASPRPAPRRGPSRRPARRTSAGPRPSARPRCAGRPATAASAAASRCASAAQRLVAVGLQRVDAQIDRRALGQRLPLRGRFDAEAFGEGRRQPFGIVAAHMHRARRRGRRREPLALGVGERRRRMALAGEQRRDLLDARARAVASARRSFRARGVASPMQPGRRRLAAQRVVDEAGDRRRGRRSRRSGGRGPSPSARRRPGGGGFRCRRALRWRRRRGRRGSCAAVARAARRSKTSRAADAADGRVRRGRRPRLQKRGGRWDALAFSDEGFPC